MSLVISSNITLSTGTVTRQFGTYSLEMDTDSVSGFSSTSVKMSKLPVLSQDFDLQIETDDLSQLKINISEIELVFFDGMGDGQSLINLIAGLDLSDAIRIKSEITPTGESARTDYFLANKSNCSYDWLTRTVTIKAVSALRYDVNIDTYSISGVTITGTASPAGGDAGQPWITPRDLITKFLESQGVSPNVVILGSVFNESFGDTFDGDYALASNPYSAPSDAYLNAQDTVIKLSVIEGAIMGVAMGDAFYVRRNYATETTVGGVNTYLTLNADDITSYQLITNERSVKNYTTRFQIEAVREHPSTSVETTYTLGSFDQEDVSTFGAFDVNLNYIYTKADNPDMYLIETVPSYGVSHADEIAYTTPYADDTFATNARKSYAAALGITGVTGALSNQMFLVEVEFFGVTSFRPFQFIKFGTDINPFLNGKKLRPSSFEYNLEQDKVKVKGYFIG